MVLKNLKKNNSCILMITTLLLVGCGEEVLSTQIGVQELSFLVTSEQQTYLTAVVDAFNQNQSNYHISFKTFQNEELKNYECFHQTTHADLIAFKNIYDANLLEDRLYSLDRANVIDKYQSSIINYLKTSEGRLNALPALGRFYTNCFNETLFKDRNFIIPKTINDLIDITQRMRKYVVGSNNKVYSSIGGTNLIVQSLMEIAFPCYLSSTEGNFFLKNYLDGNVSMLDSKYRSNWENVFELLYTMYDLQYYDINEYDSNIENGIATFKEGKSIALQNCPSYIVEEELSGMEDAYVLYPFLGDDPTERWIGSGPLYYMAVSDSVGHDKRHLEGCQEFLEFFSSEVGQQLAQYGKDDKNSKNYISYVKNKILELNSTYESVAPEVREGKIFLTDTFEYIFSFCEQPIISYLKNQISLENMMKEIDQIILEKANMEEEVYAVSEDFDFDPERTYREETKIGNYFVDTMRYQSEADVAIAPSGIIKGNIYQNGIKNSELETVILENQTLNYVYCTYRFLLERIEESLNSEELGAFPLISGVRLKKENDKIKLYTTQDQEIDLDEKCVALLPLKETDVENEETILKIGRKETVHSLIETYLERTKRLNVPSLDNRYGDVL